MTETLIALTCAHVLADFLFQNKWMVVNKLRFGGLAAHGAVVAGLTALALGGAPWAVALTTGLHLAIDAGKARLAVPGLRAFVADQVLHLASLLAIAAIWPTALSDGLWPRLGPDLLPLLVQGMVLVAGIVLATRTGQFVVGLLMAPYLGALQEEDGLENGGAMIGLLERGLTFLLVLSGQTAGVGLLMAAKSFLRVGTANENRRMAEYVIIGTLASIGWALLVSFGTVALRNLIDMP